MARAEPDAVLNESLIRSDVEYGHAARIGHGDGSPSVNPFASRIERSVDRPGDKAREAGVPDSCLSIPLKPVVVTVQVTVRRPHASVVGMITGLALDTFRHRELTSD